MNTSNSQVLKEAGFTPRALVAVKDGKVLSAKVIVASYAGAIERDAPYIRIQSYVEGLPVDLLRSDELYLFLDAKSRRVGRITPRQVLRGTLQITEFVPFGQFLKRMNQDVSYLDHVSTTDSFGVPSEFGSLLHSRVPDFFDETIVEEVELAFGDQYGALHRIEDPQAQW